jgi:hypothetical protein
MQAEHEDSAHEDREQLIAKQESIMQGLKELCASIEKKN